MSAGKNARVIPKRAIYSIGTSAYVDSAYGPLGPSVENSLAAIVEAFGSRSAVRCPSPPGYVLNPDSGEFKRILKEAGMAGDLIVVYYTGHGDAFEGDGYYLITTDFLSARRPETGMRATELPRLLVKREADGSRAREQPSMLLIIDCCFAGTGGREILRDNIFEATNTNIWVWATANVTEFAASGRFATALNKVLMNPPVGASSEHVPMETVIELVDEALDGSGQRAWMYPPAGFTRLPRFFPNPRYAPEVSGLTVDAQHWIAKVRGAPAGAGVGFYLTGRTGRASAAAGLAGWVAHADRGDLAVVTGSPGTGKSTLLALPVLLTQASSRRMLLSAAKEGSLTRSIGHLLPEHVNVIAVHARGQNTETVAQEIAKGLGFSGQSASTLLLSVEQLQGTNRAVLVVDAVEEATTPTVLRDSLLIPLSRLSGIRVLLGVRRHLVPQAVSTSLLIDLDSQEYQDPEALNDYVTQLLVAAHEPGVSTPYQDSGQTHPDTVTVADAVVARATSSTDQVESFLEARVLALVLRGRPNRVDITTDAWLNELPTGLGDAFEQDILRFGKRAQTARTLLESLAWARGTGLPWERIWVRIANALVAPPGVSIGPVQRFSDEDVRWLLEQMGGYVVEDVGPGGHSVFRPFHDRLAEYLTSGGLLDSDPAQKQAILAEALHNSVPQDPMGRPLWTRAHPYVRSYLIEHASIAGLEAVLPLLADPGFLSVADPTTLMPVLRGIETAVSNVPVVYGRVRPLLGEDFNSNAGYLLESSLALTGTPLVFDCSDIEPQFRAVWANVRPDHSLLTLSGHDGPVRAIAFGVLPGGQPVLASAGDDRTVRLWNPETGEQIGDSLAGHTGPVRAVAFGARHGVLPVLVSAGDDYTVRFWDPETGEPVGDPLRRRAVRRSDGERLVALTFGTGVRGESLLASAEIDGSVRLWDAVSVKRAGGGMTGAVAPSTVLFCSGLNGPIVVAAISYLGAVQLWDPANGGRSGSPRRRRDRATRRRLEPGSLLAAATTQDGRIVLASVERNGAVLMWDPEDGLPFKVSRSPRLADATTLALRTQEDGQYFLASGSANGEVRLTETTTGEQIGEPNKGHVGPVTSLAFGERSDGQFTLASGGVDGTVRLWGAEPRERDISIHRGYKGQITAVGLGFGPNRAALLVSGGVDGAVRLWELSTGLQINSFRGERRGGHGAEVTALAIDYRRNGNPIIGSGDADGAVVLWDPLRGSRSRFAPFESPNWSGLSKAATAVAMGTTDNGELVLASGSADGRVAFWVPAVTGFESQVQSLDIFDPIESIVFGKTHIGGPRVFAVMSAGGTLRIWNATTWKRLRGFGRGGLSHCRPIAVATQDDGQIIAASGVQGSGLRLWKAPEGWRDIGVSGVHRGPVSSLAFGTNANGGALLASGGVDGKVVLWDPANGERVADFRQAHSGRITALAFLAGADGRVLLASGGVDRLVCLWDVSSGTRDLVIRRRSSVRSLLGSGTRLAISDAEGASIIEMGT